MCLTYELVSLFLDFSWSRLDETHRKAKRPFVTATVLSLCFNLKNENQVNGLIESYLRSERTIILAIVPSNQDVATVDILERAKKVTFVCD